MTGSQPDDGERVIQGSRRPDGTYRKDVRVRAGYVPQDEQPVYVPRGALVQRSGPKVPGLDDADLEAAKASARSKAAKKNAQRKAKKAAEDAAAVDGVSNGMAAVRLGDSGGHGGVQAASKSASSGSQAAAAAAKPPSQEATGGQPSAAEKLLRALQKKMRQCEALQERVAKGEPLTQPEKEKLSKFPGWKEEAQQLEELIRKQ
ncbi:g10087 [Coccomyxa elongata]